MAKRDKELEWMRFRLEMVRCRKRLKQWPNVLEWPDKKGSGS
jgi:hypothetical protein